ncbi:MAG: alpha/beta hydrolase [Hyphomicrobiales bacterium]|nr:alpha/beta hydrolase [Hyphomicrobiales bacterium]
MEFLFKEGADGTRDIWIALHGSGRDETDMVPLVREISPEASILSIRGTVSCDGGYAFFHRDQANRPDPADLRERSRQLEAFLGEYACNHLAGRNLVLCGFSNGAVMGASLLLRGNCRFSSALLFRPMLPFRLTTAHPNLQIPVLLVDAKNDGRRKPQNAVSLANELK